MSSRCRPGGRPGIDQAKDRSLSLVGLHLAHTLPTPGWCPVPSSSSPLLPSHSSSWSTSRLQLIVHSQFMVAVAVPDPTMVDCEHERSTMAQTIVGSHDVRIVVDGCSWPCSKPGKSHTPPFLFLVACFWPPSLRHVCWNKHCFFKWFDFFFCVLKVVFTGLRLFWVDYNDVSGQIHAEKLQPTQELAYGRPPVLCDIPGLRLATKSVAHVTIASLSHVKGNRSENTLRCLAS